MFRGIVSTNTSTADRLLIDVRTAKFVVVVLIREHIIAMTITLQLLTWMNIIVIHGFYTSTSSSNHRQHQPANFFPPLAAVSVTEAMSSMSPMGAYQKLWTDVDGVTDTRPKIFGDSVKIVCYNCLGPLHGEGSKHDYASVSVTKWTRRRDRLLEELRGMSADIFCLQEISAKALRETFIPNLKHVGLECFGFAPSKQADKVRGKFGHKHVGCAIFGRAEKFNIISSKRVHLRDFGPLEGCRSHRFHVDFTAKWNSMAMLMVQLKDTNQILCIANTHIFWNPARADIKAMQTAAVMDAINKFYIELGFTKNQPQPPLVLCGDFNTVPDLGFDDTGCKPSAPFQLLEHGVLKTSHPQHPDTFYSKVECIPGKPGHQSPENPRLGEFSTGWKLRNAYDLPEFDGQQPLFTTKTDDFQGWIDHIWISDDVDVTNVLSPPIRRGDLEAGHKARSFSPIPSKNYPSDHLPIGVIVKIKGGEGYTARTPLAHAQAVQQQLSADEAASEAGAGAGADTGAGAGPGADSDDDE